MAWFHCCLAEVSIANTLLSQNKDNYLCIKWMFKDPVLNQTFYLSVPIWNWQYLSSPHALWSNEHYKSCLLLHLGWKLKAVPCRKLLSAQNSTQAVAALLCSHVTFLPVMYVCVERGQAGSNCFTDRKDIDRCTEAFWNKNGAASTETTDAALWKYFFHYSSNVISHLSPSEVQKELISRVPILASGIPPASQPQKREWVFNRHRGGGTICLRLGPRKERNFCPSEREACSSLSGGGISHVESSVLKKGWRGPGEGRALCKNFLPFLFYSVGL